MELKGTYFKICKYSIDENAMRQNDIMLNESNMSGIMPFQVAFNNDK